MCKSHVATPFQLQSIQRPTPSYQDTLCPAPSARTSWLATTKAKCKTGTTNAKKTIDNDQSRLKPTSPADLTTVTTSPITPTVNVLKKIHLHIRHDSKTAIINYPRLAGCWSSILVELLTDVICSCPCAFSTTPINQAPISVRPPALTKLEKSQVDVVLCYSPLSRIYSI